MTHRDIAEIAHHLRAHNEVNYALFWVSAGTRSSASAPRPKRLGRPAEMTVGPRARIFAEAPSSRIRESHRDRQVLRGVSRWRAGASRTRIYDSCSSPLSIARRMLPSDEVPSDQAAAHSDMLIMPRVAACDAL